MNEAPRMMLVPIALRDGLEVRMHFPADITKAEAEKVARVIMAYATPLEHSPATVKDSQ